MTAAEQLFSGIPKGFGGLSNEKELAKMCPEEFKRGNHWTRIVSECFVAGSRKANLRYKSEDRTVRTKQWDCFRAVLATFDLPHQDKVAVAAWMLSECVIEVDPNAS